VIAYIGHLFHVKGVAALLRAMTAHPDLNLVIADSGLGNKAAVHWHVRKLGISDRGRFLGRVDVSGLLRAVDALVLPYRAGFGTVVFPNLLLEAIAIVVPVVSSDVPVVRELFGSSAAVVLAEPEDSDSLAVAIGRVLASDRGGLFAANAARRAAARMSCRSCRRLPAAIRRQLFRRARQHPIRLSLCRSVGVFRGSVSRPQAGRRPGVRHV